MPLTSACQVTGPTIPSTVTDWNVERKGLLKATHRSVCHWSEDPVDLGPVGGIAGQVAELELLLHAPDRVALASLLDLHDNAPPR